MTEKHIWENGETITADLLNGMSEYVDDEHAQVTKQLADKAVFVTPEMFGALGDGVTDDTNALQDAIDFCQLNKGTLIFKYGKTYIVTATINITDILNINMNGALIKNTTALLDKVINIYYPSLVADRTRQGKKSYMSLNVDGGGATHGVYGGNLNEVTIYKTTVRGCVNSIYVAAGSEAIFEDIYCVGDGSNASLGIEINTSDCFFNNIYMFECHTGFKNNGSNHITNFHPWLLTNFNGSIGLNHVGGTLITNGYYADSYQYPVRKSNSGMLSLVNFRTFYNTEYYTDAYDAPVIFYSEDGTQRFEYSSFSNCDIRGTVVGTSLSNVTPLRFPSSNNKFDLINIAHISNLNNYPIVLEAGITADYNIVRANNGVGVVDCALVATNFPHNTTIGTTQGLPRYITYMIGLLSNASTPNTINVMPCTVTIDTAGLVKIYRQTADATVYTHLYLSGSFVTTKN